MANIFNQTFEQKLIYVYRINDADHEGILKIGEASCNAGMNYFAFEPNCKELNAAAKERIKHQTQTAGIKFELLYTEATAYMKNKHLIVFQDHEVHDVLKRSGIKQKTFATDANGYKANEWFYTDLETVKKAITAVKEGRTSLNASEISTDKSPVIFRPEQREAIDKTIKQFNKKNSSHQMLWNAKMRFGKTLTALQVIKECDIRRTLILTHRPVVDKGWFEDYEKIFYDRAEFLYGSKTRGASLDECEHIYGETKTGSYIYFASIQDMRGSELVGGKFTKNEELFNINWDLIIIDEAHEGTQTELGKAVLVACRKKDTRILHLSGTPFNLIDGFKEEEIFTWDYVMEQRAKNEWDAIHKGDPNPYSVLPRLSIYTYNLGKLYPEYADADIAFNFREFFRTNSDGDFIHEANVKQFLDLLTKVDTDSNYPYSTEEYRQNFRHSLWMIPGVKEAKALSKLLQEHPVFSQFNIANVAGDGDEEENEKEALKKVEKAIGSNPEETYSITLSCGRLTTGVSVKPWTACFMLSGSFNTAASTYMQTIFRVQTPASIGGKQKTECFVFDFAPDRTLKVIAETAKISSKAGKTTNNDREILGEFLNFCPIIGFEGSQMKAYNTEKMLGQLKKAYIERVVKNGFEDSYLYNDELLCMDKLALEEFNKLKAIIGLTKTQGKMGDININAQGLTDEQYELLALPEIREKPIKELTLEQQEALAREKEIKKNRDTAISILRGISIRMPLLIYGADLQRNLDGTEEAITLDNFTDLVDDLSWEEFMPKGVTKETFGQFKKYYDADVFRESGVRIREMARAADKLSIEERIERISAIFGTFRNPDKETVLTPWRVVNMHLSQSLGGWCFYDDKFKETLLEPVFVKHKDITADVFKKNTHILEINSKSGLYALYCAYSVYRARSKLELGPKPTREMEKDLWKRVLEENIFLICKTPMAKKIAQRTLAGFSEAKVNAHYFEDLVNQLKNKPENFISKVSKTNYWKKDGNEDMKFDAIVGNPPYQLEGHGQKPLPIYQYFVDVAKKLEPTYISMIMKSNWYTDNELKLFRDSMVSDNHLEILHDFVDARDCFTNVEIKGGVCFFLWNKEKYSEETTIITHINDEIDSCSRKLKSENFGIILRDNSAIKILEKVIANTNYYMSSLISMNDPFGFDMREEHSSKRLKVEFDKQPFANGVEFYYNGWRKDGVGYINRSKIRKHPEWIDSFKVLIPKAWGTGKSETDRLNPFIVSPNSCCTETYLVIGPFENEELCKNTVSYIQTKFFHFCVSVIKITQNSMQGNYRFVPLQDFTANSDIDWSKSVAEIDKQLYKKYGLTAEEIDFIEGKVKEM